MTDDRVEIIPKPPLFTKFMGSKSAILSSIFERLDRFDYDSVLDAFSGSGSVAYEFKKRMKEVTTNDFLNFSYEICKGVIENSKEKIDDDLLTTLMTVRSEALTKVRKIFTDLYFSDKECLFLDTLWTNISEIPYSYKRHLALAAACRACQKKYPRGIFTVVGNKGRDHRRDFKIGLHEHFVNAVGQFNDAVFDNRRTNKAFCQNIMNFDKTEFDLVYFDPPYWSPLSDNDYVRRYHFIEGYSKYWDGLEINEKTKTKKFDSSYYPTPFSKKETATSALNELFERFSNSIIAVSYSSNCLPTMSELKQMIGKVKDMVEVTRIPHTYSFGNQGYAAGRIKHRVEEYLFVGYDRKQKHSKQGMSTRSGF
jgi:DNA adenine methylase